MTEARWEPRWHEFKKMHDGPACPLGHSISLLLQDPAFKGHGFRPCPACGEFLYLLVVAGGGVLVIHAREDEARRLARSPYEMSAADILLYFGVFKKRSAA